MSALEYARILISIDYRPSYKTFTILFTISFLQNPSYMSHHVSSHQSFSCKFHADGTVYRQFVWMICVERVFFFNLFHNFLTGFRGITVFICTNMCVCCVIVSLEISTKYNTTQTRHIAEQIRKDFNECNSVRVVHFIATMLRIYSANGSEKNSI